MKIVQSSPAIRELLLLGLGVSLASCASIGTSDRRVELSDASMSRADESVTTRYQVSFVPSWNPATNPFEYPYPHAKQGFLTPAIGATHGSNYAVFTPGSEPTPGLEKLSETGKQTPLDVEIEAAIGAGDAENLIRFSEGSAGPVHGPITTTFQITKDAPMVSLAGMIAPSPDWFYGASSIELRKGGRWLSSLTVPVFAWDSGGDGGTTYLAEDMDLNPKQPTRKASTAHFVRGGRPCPVGYFVFKQVPVEN